MQELLLVLSRFVSYRSVAVCIVATPILHIVGISYFGLPQARFRLLAFPWSGGKRSAAFQVTGWFMWAASALACVPLWLPSLAQALPALRHLQLRDHLVPQSHTDVLSGATAASSFIGLLFLLKSMLVFERPTAMDEPATVTLRRLKRRLMQSPAGQTLIKHGPAAAVLLMGALLSLTGVLLLLSVEHMPDIPSRVLYCCLALVCLIIGASSTHGLGGYLRWGRRHSYAHPYPHPLLSTTPTSSGSTTQVSTPLAMTRTGMLRRRREPAGGRVHADETDLGVSVGRGLLLAGRVDSVPGQLQDVVPGGDTSPSTGTHSPSPAGQADMDSSVTAATRVQGLCKVQHGSALSLAADESGDESSGRSGSESGRVGVCADRGRSGYESGRVEPGAREAAWAFFQPFAGGTLFVVTQAVGWSLFAITIVLIVALAKALVTGVVSCVWAWVVSAGALMMLTQIVLAVSVLTWRNSETARNLVQPILAAGTRTLRRSSPGTPAASPRGGPPPLPLGSVLAPLDLGTRQQGRPAVQQRREWGVKACWRRVVSGVGSALALHGPMVIMYMPVQTFFTLWTLTFAFCPTHWAVLGWLTLLPAGYVLSLVGEPQHTGARTWPAFREWFAASIEHSLTWWFGAVEVLADWEEPEEGGTACASDSSGGRAAGPTDAESAVAARTESGSEAGRAVLPPPPENKYIFGFHPHGLYPTGAGFVPLLPSFRRLLPGITPITLTASVIYYLPAIKDLSLFLGFRQVSRRTFVRALRDMRSVMICPGGQAELMYAHASHTPVPTVQPIQPPPPPGAANARPHASHSISDPSPGKEAGIAVMPGGAGTAAAPLRLVASSRDLVQAPLARTAEPEVMGPAAGEAEGAAAEAEAAAGEAEAAAGAEHSQDQAAVTEGVAVEADDAAGRAAGDSGVSTPRCECHADPQVHCDTPDDASTSRGGQWESDGDWERLSLTTAGAGSGCDSSGTPGTATPSGEDPGLRHRPCVDGGRRQRGGTRERAVEDCDRQSVSSHGSCTDLPCQSTSHSTSTSIKHMSEATMPGTTAGCTTGSTGSDAVASTSSAWPTHGTPPCSRLQYLFQRLRGGPAHDTIPAAAQVEVGPAGQLVIYKGHKGFVRLAIEQQASLVPVLALGEVLQLRDLLRSPGLLKWTYKCFGFPLPYLIVGRCGLLPWPSRTPLIYIIGKPIPPPAHTGGAVSQADVDALHRDFYASLEAMFHRHAHRHPAFKDAQLVMLDGHTSDV